MTKRPTLIVLLTLLWGSEWLLTSELSNQPRLRVLALRCVAGAVVIMPFALRAGSRKQPVSFLRNCLLGLGIMAAPALLSLLAPEISPGLEVLLFAMMPLAATLFENRGGIAGAAYLLGGLLGIAFLVRGALSFSPTQGVAVFWVPLSVLVVGWSVVKAKQWLPEQNLSGAIAIQLLAASAAIGICSLLREPVGDPWGDPWTLRQAGAVILLGAAGSAVAYAILYRLLRYYRPGQITVVQWLIPIAGVAETAIFLHRFPAWDSCAGGALAILCAVLLLRMDPGTPDDTPDTILSINS